MKPVKILIIDKDVVVRQAIVSILRNYPHYQIAGAVGGIEEITENISSNKPDIILLNVENENHKIQSLFSTLSEQLPSLPVIALSSRTKAGAQQVFQALNVGAIDYITKPQSSNDLLFSHNHLKKRLAPIINTALSLAEEPQPSEIMTRNLVAKIPANKFKILVIGGCTGGPKALFSLIPNLPSDFTIPVVIAQHSPKFYSTELAQQLDGQANLSVRVATNGAILKPGVVWIAPGGYHTEIQRQGTQRVLKVHKGIREKEHRPSIDLLFRSASKVFGSRALAVTLSNSGKDGLAGMKAIRASGGQALVQQPGANLSSEFLNAVIRSGYTSILRQTKKMAD